MDRKPKARPVARKETVRDDPEQSMRFIEAARVNALEASEDKLETAFKRLVRLKPERR